MIRAKLKRLLFALWIASFTLTSMAGAERCSLMNKSHLLSLLEKVYLDGDSVYVVDIYSDFPKYAPVEAKGEGFACVDDAARAVVFLAKYDEMLNTQADREMISGLVKFILKMQTEDGRFYNFLQKTNGRVLINRTGETSRASFGWWAARAIWALGTSALYLKDTDSLLYAQVVESLGRTKPQIDSVLSKFNVEDSSGAPTWLLFGDGADASSELVLGLNEAYRATKDSAYLKFSEEFCYGLLKLQRGTCKEFPFFAFLSNKQEWHAWANSQSAALLDFYTIKPNTKFLRAALREVDCFLPRWVGTWFFREFHSGSTHLNYYAQIAYNIRPALFSSVKAYQITKLEKYRTLALLISSWFFGNNIAKTKMYDSATGRCFDGIEDSIHVNINSGAESTIEALFSMLLLKQADASACNIKSLSPPFLAAKRFLFDINGKKVVLQMTKDGFRVIIGR